MTELKIWGLPWEIATEHTEEKLLTCGYLDPDKRRIVIRDDVSVPEGYAEIVRLAFVIRRLGLIKEGWENVSPMLALKHIAWQMERGYGKEESR